MPQVPEIEIKEVKFLVPAKVTMEISGEEVTKVFHVDIANKDLVIEGSSEWTDEIKEKFFEFLASLNPPEDNFEANDEIYEKAARAHQEFDRTYEEQI